MGNQCLKARGMAVATLRGRGMAEPWEGPEELRFDYVYFTPKNLTLLGVQQLPGGCGNSP